MFGSEPGNDDGSEEKYKIGHWRTGCGTRPEEGFPEPSWCGIAIQFAANHRYKEFSPSGVDASA